MFPPTATHKLPFASKVSPCGTALRTIVNAGAGGAWAVAAASEAALNSTRSYAVLIELIVRPSVAQRSPLGSKARASTKFARPTKGTPAALPASKALCGYSVIHDMLPEHTPLAIPLCATHTAVKGRAAPVAVGEDDGDGVADGAALGVTVRAGVGLVFGEMLRVALGEGVIETIGAIGTPCEESHAVSRAAAKSGRAAIGKTLRFSCVTATV